MVTQGAPQVPGAKAPARVTFEAEFTGAGNNPFNEKPTIGFAGETSIKRSDFGVNYGIPFVSDAVELDISVAFEKQ
jgi:polyisoprenoid-binding protein YceI